MRIWILTSELPANITGGIARYVDNYARLLGARGHDVTLIAITPNTYEQDYAPGVKLFGVQQGNPAHTELLRFPQARQNLLKHLTQILTWGPDQSYLLAEAAIELLKRLPAPDIIEVQEVGAIPYFLLLRKLTEFGLLQQIPVLVHLHTSAYDVWRVNNDQVYRLPEYWITQMEKFSIAAADGLLCPSHYLADHVAKTYQNPSLNIEVIPLPSYLPESVLQQTSRPEPRHLIYFGRLEVRKGVLPLIAACDELWANGEAFKLTLIGKDTNHSIYGETVGEHIRKHYANHIEAGRLVLQAPSYSFADLMQHIQKAWAIIVPSLFENFPNTCMEAMALGQVVLVSTDGGHVEMIEHDGVNGFLFDWAVPGQLQAQLLRVLGLSHSDREQMGQRARARIATMCDPNIIIPQRLAHYQHIIDTHSQKRHFPTVHVAPAVAIPDAQVKTQSIAMQKDLLSIVICSNEAGQPLYQLILNALASNYVPKEVIVAYPAQLDLTPLQQRFAALEVDLSAVKLMPISADVWQQAPKQAKLREALAHCVSGEFITFWTENESVALDFCARAIAVLKQYDNVAVVYAWTETDHAPHPIQTAWNAEFPLQLVYNMVPDMLLARRDVFIQSSLGQSRVGTDDSQMRDHERWINMLERHYIGVCLPHPLIQSSAHEKNAVTLQENLQSILAHMTLRSRHLTSFEKYASTLFELSNANGPIYHWRHLGEEAGYHEFQRLHELLERKTPTEITLEQVQTDVPVIPPKIEPAQPDLPLNQVLVPKDKIYLPVPTRWRDLLRILIILLPGVFTSRYVKLKCWLGWTTANIPPTQTAPITTPDVKIAQPEINVPIDQVLIPKDKIYLPVPTRWRDLLRILIILLPGVFTSRYHQLRLWLGVPIKTQIQDEVGLSTATSDVSRLETPSRVINPAPILKTNPTVAVVIPTAGTFDITKTLQALTEQSYLAQEIIVVESAGVSESARSFLAQYQHQPGQNPLLRIIAEPRPRANIARNTGIKASSAQIIALIDDDVIPDKGWLKAFVTALETRPDGPFDGIVGGKVNLSYQTPKPAWCVGLFERYLAQLHYGETSHLLTAHDYLVTASMAFYRSTYDKLGEFSEMEMGGEKQMTNDEHLFLEAARHNTKGLLYCADAIAEHQIPPHRITMEYFTKRAHLQGAADVALQYYLNPTQSRSSGLAFLKGVMEVSYASTQSLNNEGLTQVPVGHEDEFIENLLLMRIAYINGVHASYKQYFEDAT